MYVSAFCLSIIGLLFALTHILFDIQSFNINGLPSIFHVSQLLMWISFYFLVSKAGSKRRL